MGVLIKVCNVLVLVLVFKEFIFKLEFILLFKIDE